MNPPKNKRIWAVRVELPREGGHTAPELGPGMSYDQAERERIFWVTRHKFAASVVLLDDWQELIAAKKGVRR